MGETLVVKIKATDITAVSDALNEVLNALAADGAVDDADDEGWAYTDADGNLLGATV